MAGEAYADKLNGFNPDGFFRTHTFSFNRSLTLDLNSAGARSAGNLHAACDVAGAGNGITEISKRARKRKRRIQPRNFLRIYAPALDPTRC